MKYKLKNTGFSLTEVLLSVGILAVGMIFVAGVFPVGIHFTTIATERTIAAVVTDEAFAKIKLYSGVDTTWLSALPPTGCVDFNDIVVLDRDEFAYPSDPNINISQKQYCWSALCRRVDPNSQLVQVTVFVSRKVGSHLQYYDPNVGGVVDWPIPDEADWPVPVKVEVDQSGLRDNELQVENFNIRIFINDGYTIVDDETGRIYRVLERYTDEPDTILLDRDWDEDSPDPEAVWVVPPPVNGNRYPCIAIYQKVIRF